MCVKWHEKCSPAGEGFDVLVADRLEGLLTPQPVAPEHPGTRQAIAHAHERKGP